MESGKDQIRQARINRDITSGSKKLLVPGDIKLKERLSEAEIAGGKFLKLKISYEN